MNKGIIDEEKWLQTIGNFLERYLKIRPFLAEPLILESWSQKKKYSMEYFTMGLERNKIDIIDSMN